MDRKHSWKLSHVASVAVWELEVGKMDGHKVCQVTASLSGREGTLVRRWQMPAGIPDSSILEDIAAWLVNGVTTAVITSVGAQTMLDLGPE